MPAGGTVYYLNSVDYSVNKEAGTLNQLDRWNQVPEAQMDMGGAFYFRVTSRGAWKLVDDSDLKYVHPPRRDSIISRIRPLPTR